MFKNKKILILGFARSGYETAKILINRNNTVILNDSKDEDKHDASRVKELRDMGVEFVFGGHPDDLLDESFDYLIKNPGVPIDHKYVLKARELGIEVINEVEMAYRLIDKDIKIVSITGTNGKTTTTTLTYNILKNAYEHTKINGEIKIDVLDNPIYTEINITDNGEGISKDDINHIFERFYKGENNKESIGIGLNMAKTIIEKENGIIEVTSEKNKYTTFKIKFYK